MTIHSDSQERAKKRVERVKAACEGAPEMRSIAHEAATEAVHAHERHDHKGKKETPAAAMCSGGAAKKRLDRAGYKKGGRTKPNTEVNVIVGEGPKAGAPGAGAMPPPRPPMAPPPAAAAPPRPPMAPPPGGMPPGAAPGMGPGAAPGIPPRKRGGRSPEFDYTGGAGGGLGRVEKIAKYGNKT